MDTVRLSSSSPIQRRNINLSQTHSKPQFCVCSTMSRKLPAQLSNRRHSSPMSYLSWQWENSANLKSKSYWRRSTSLFSAITRKLRWMRSSPSSQFVAIWSPKKLLRKRPRRPLLKKRSNTNRLQRSAPTSFKPTLLKWWRRKSHTDSNRLWPMWCAILACSKPIQRWSKNRSRFWFKETTWSVTKMIEPYSYMCLESFIECLRRQ